MAGTRRRFDRSLRAARGRARVERERRSAELKWGILEMALTGPGACSEVARAPHLTRVVAEEGGEEGMVQACDSIELLLPGAGEDVWRRARSVVSSSAC